MDLRKTARGWLRVIDMQNWSAWKVLSIGVPEWSASLVVMLYEVPMTVVEQIETGLPVLTERIRSTEVLKSCELLQRMPN